MTMTIKQFCEMTGLKRITVTNAVKRLFPEIIKNGITTYLDEMQSTEIIKELRIKNLPNLSKNMQVENLQKQQNSEVMVQQFTQAINLFTKTLEIMDKRLTNIENSQVSQVKQIEQPKEIKPLKQKYSVKQYITKNNIKSYNMNLFSNQVGRALTKLSRDLHREIGFIREGDYDVGLYDEDLFETAVIVATKMIEKNNTLF
jgi:DNA-binding Lrp family transcriptional regulator